MPELTPQQALAEFEAGSSYDEMMKKYKLGKYQIESLVKRGREALTPEEGPASSGGDWAGKVIRVPEFVPKENLYEVVKPVSFEPVSGGGPFEVGDVICAESFPHRKYSEMRLRNLLNEGKIRGL